MSKTTPKIYSMYKKSKYAYLYGAAWGFGVLWVLELEVRAMEKEREGGR